MVMAAAAGRCAQLAIVHRPPRPSHPPSRCPCPCPCLPAVKPDNMLVFGRGEDEATKEVYPIIKISDFGLARASEQQGRRRRRYSQATAQPRRASSRVVPCCRVVWCLAVDPDAKKYTTKVGTKSYRAPELALPKYDAKVDIFSAGCTFFALGALPLPRCQYRECRLVPRSAHPPAH